MAMAIASESLAYAIPALPGASDAQTFAQPDISDGPVTSSSHAPLSSRALPATNSLPATFPRQLANFPSVSPALSVMIPTAANSLQASPNASQVRNSLELLCFLRIIDIQPGRALMTSQQSC